MTTTTLTESRVKALQSRKSVRDIRDRHLRDFGVRVYPSGRKRYFIHIQHEGRRAWRVVGDAAVIRLTDAREQARSMMAATRSGVPQQTDHTLFEAVAGEVFQRYGRCNWKPTTFKVNWYYLKNQLLPWFQGCQIGDITAADVQEWFASLHKTPVAANRAAPVLSVIMACAETYGYRLEGSNPCRGIRRYRRQGRERFLSVEEINRIGANLKRLHDTHPILVAIIRLLLLTGCRKTEVVTLRWRDYRNGHIHLSDSKVGLRMVWLSTPARRILDGLHRKSTWVFPSPRTDQSLTTTPVERLWKRIRSEAGLQDVRLHDLRHTYASHAVMHGTPLTVVSRLLGHSRPTTTMRYAHLGDRETEAAAERIGTVIAGMLDLR